ncbi:ABC transporter permease [Streptomyces cyaneofuscatus]|uniref:ABC transporter permease n=1 Tax=Streptomyces cyaneofuscatus TaxID=66883 RepID=A0ABZ1F0Z1_9ACTN|nr:ABC transporter permease [Streptomyces cyaneofuscatus]WSB10006.1 ABC transporter permease [Streptomyces cyaneofuscatus]WSD46461.1 ABC transporter permease [Streptomyces cyaneofuscatus]
MTTVRHHRVRAVLVRLGTSVLVLWGAVTVSFAALRLTPGSVEDALIGTSTVTPEVRAQIVADYGLDQPFLVQYGTYLGNVLTGDLGHSYRLHQSVTSAVGSQAGDSVALALTALALALVASTVLALLTARRARWLRGLSSGVELVGVSVPTFWVGILLLTFFSFRLGWFPAAGGEGLAGLVLPAVAVAVPLTALLTQVMREGLEIALDEPFVLTARARGMSDAGVRLRHALRHALLPVVTLAGWMLGSLIGALVVIEQVFNRQGVGRLVLAAVQDKDLPVVMGVVLLSAAVYVTVSALLDLVYRIVDPRLRGTA